MMLATEHTAPVPPRNSDSLVRAIAKRNCVTIEDMTGPTRTRAAVRARREASWLFRKRRHYSISRIAEILSKHPSTIRREVVSADAIICADMFARDELAGLVA